MKKLQLIACLFLFTIFGFAQQKQYSLEEQAIIKIIKADHLYYCQNDYEKWSNMYVHKPYTTFTFTTTGNTNILKGWVALSKMVKEGMDWNMANDRTISPAKQTDFTINVKGNMALAHYSEGKQFSTRGLEKVNGEWKLFLVSIINTPSFEVKSQVDLLKKLRGEWISKIDEQTRPNAEIKVVISPMEDDQYFSLQTLIQENKNGWTPAFESRLFYNPQTQKVDILGYWKRGNPTVSRGEGYFGAANEFTMEFRDAADGAKVFSKIKYTLTSDNEIKVDRVQYQGDTPQEIKSVLKRIKQM